MRLRVSLVVIAMLGIIGIPSLIEAATGIGQADAPAWRFTVHTIQDPYAGDLKEPAEGVRYLGVEVEIANDSTQGLNFIATDVRLRDATGQEYRPGTVMGTEPRLGSRNLNPGELARGWVWFAVPPDAVVSQVLFAAPRAEFRVDLAAE